MMYYYQAQYDGTFSQKKYYKYPELGLNPLINPLTSTCENLTMLQQYISVEKVYNRPWVVQFIKAMSENTFWTKSSKNAQIVHNL